MVLRLIEPKKKLKIDTVLNLILSELVKKRS